MTKFSLRPPEIDKAEPSPEGIEANLIAEIRTALHNAFDDRLSGLSREIETTMFALFELREASHVTDIFGEKLFGELALDLRKTGQVECRDDESKIIASLESTEELLNFLALVKGIPTIFAKVEALKAAANHKIADQQRKMQNAQASICRVNEIPEQNKDRKSLAEHVRETSVLNEAREKKLKLENRTRELNEQISDLCSGTQTVEGFKVSLKFFLTYLKANNWINGAEANSLSAEISKIPDNKVFVQVEITRKKLQPVVPPALKRRGSDLRSCLFLLAAAALVGYSVKMACHYSPRPENPSTRISSNSNPPEARLNADPQRKDLLRKYALVFNLESEEEIKEHLMNLAIMDIEETIANLAKTKIGDRFPTIVVSAGPLLGYIYATGHVMDIDGTDALIRIDFPIDPTWSSEHKFSLNQD